MAYFLNYLFNIIKSAWIVLSINALILERSHFIYNVVLDLDLDSEDEDQDEQKSLELSRSNSTRIKSTIPTAAKLSTSQDSIVKIKPLPLTTHLVETKPSGKNQRYTYRVLQTIQMKFILLWIWAEWAVLGRAKTALKFKYEIWIG